MTELECGRVQFFNTNKGFGFIRPDEPREDGRNIFFHVRDGRRIVENTLGALDFEMESSINVIPCQDERLVYSSGDNARGPVAFQWNLEANWAKAEEFIDLRPWPWCPLCRVVRRRGSERVVLWRGWYVTLREKLAKGAGEFLEDKRNDGWYQNVWCEELRFSGYERMWNPLDPGLKLKPMIITPEEREHLAKFQVA